MKTNILILCHSSFSCDDHLQPTRHGIAQVPEGLGLHLIEPDVLNGQDEFGCGAGVLPPQLVLHVIPAVLNWVEVRTVPRPVHHLEQLVFQELLIFLEA